ncbi:hypothetical protein [Mariniblastus fucicola]|uniref:hypothetical protein n=1 Tax=Mariniblastus fucicola TaxID=980251 RepID=UPI0011DFFCC0|nr:hypothetical protein [Mariniblastus fucicola]
MKSGKKWQSRASIVLAGFALGYLARYIMPPEVESTLPTREFNEPLAAETSIGDLPILPVEDDFEFPVPYEIP